VPKKPLAEDEKREHLDEHLPYMLKTVRHDIEEICRPRQYYLSFNAHFESFAVNARNLVKFLTNGDKGNLQANDFIEGGFKSRVGDIATPMAKLDKQVFHLDRNRPREDGKFDTENAKEVHDWIENSFQSFHDALSPTDKALFNAAKATPEPAALRSGSGTPSASAAGPTSVSLTVGVNATTSEIRLPK
jgi:hypothetical protein